MNIKKTSTLGFEYCESVTPAFLCHTCNVVGQVDEFSYRAVTPVAQMVFLSPALKLLCKAAKRAKFGLQCRCQQLDIQDPILKCKLSDTLVRPILCYCCEVWSFMGSKSDLKNLEQVELGFLKALLGVQTSTKRLHVYAEFGRYPLHTVSMAITGCQVLEKA